MAVPGSLSYFQRPLFQWINRKVETVLTFEKALFFLLLLLFLLPVWKEKYILNTDGPSHCYTSKVLLDYATGKNVAFYNQYYKLQLFPDPNWFSRFSLMFLQVFFNWRIAEKILVSIYIILFPILFRQLILQINPANGILSLFIFPFLYHHVFNYGFYNYSFALVFFFGFLLFWKRNHDHLNLKNCVAGTLLCTLIYFTHLWGFVFTGFFTGCLLIYDSLVRLREKPLSAVFKEMILKFSKLGIMMLPGLIMSLIFIKKFLLKEELDYNEPSELWQGFYSLTALSIYSLKELTPAICMSITILALFLISIIMKVVKPRWTGDDGLLLCAIISTIIYFIEPERLTVGAFWIFRMVMLPYLFIILWCASAQHYKYVKLILAGAVVFAGVYGFALRWPYYHRVSQSMEEYLSVSPQIPLRSTVLPISFCHEGNMPDGSKACPQFWKFIHAFDYACIDREAIDFSHNNWIPLLWKDDRNPYTKMGDMEEQPPISNFADYAKNSNGGKVEYVVTWCMDNNFVGRPEWTHIKNQLNDHYDLVASSPHHLAKLYRLKK